MTVKKNQRSQKPKTCRVQLAVAAVEDSGRPLDLDVRDLDTSPTALGLDDGNETGTCPHRRYVCAECGRPLREGCS